MAQRRTLCRLPAAVLAGALVLALALAGGAALASGGGEDGTDSDAAESDAEQVVTDEATIEVAWKDVNGEEGVDTYTLSAEEQATDNAESDPSPTGDADLGLTEDPAKDAGGGHRPDAAGSVSHRGRGPGLAGGSRESLKWDLGSRVRVAGRGHPPAPGRR